MIRSWSWFWRSCELESHMRKPCGHRLGKHALYPQPARLEQPFRLSLERNRLERNRLERNRLEPDRLGGDQQPKRRQV